VNKFFVKNLWNAAELLKIKERLTAKGVRHKGRCRMQDSEMAQGRIIG
jgi:hypothetical protein